MSCLDIKRKLHGYGRRGNRGMFFIGVFGIQDREKNMGSISGTCGSCESESGIVVRRERIFHFFFLPLFHWNREYRLICRGCGQVAEITEERAERLLAGEPMGPWDLPKQNASRERHCSNCGSPAKEQDRYCAQCGQKLEGR